MGSVLLKRLLGAKKAAQRLWEQETQTGHYRKIKSRASILRARDLNDKRIFCQQKLLDPWAGAWHGGLAVDFVRLLRQSGLNSSWLALHGQDLSQDNM